MPQREYLRVQEDQRFNLGVVIVYPQRPYVIAIRSHAAWGRRFPKPHSVEHRLVVIARQGQIIPYSGSAGPFGDTLRSKAVPKPAYISSCICAMERKPIVASPAPNTAKGPKPKQAQQTVGRMELGCFEFNRCASWTRMPNEKQMRKPSGPTRACRIHYYCPFQCVTSWSLLGQSASPAHASKERMLPWPCENPLAPKYRWIVFSRKHLKLH